MARKRYKEPPVTEAICEFRFESDSPWDLAVPGLMYEELRTDLPKRRQASLIEATAQPAGDGIQQQLVQANRLQLLQEDEKSVVQVGTDFLSINRLAPYLGWEHFLPLVQKSLDAYQKVASPRGFQQITVRYINRFGFDGPVKLEDYFEFYPYLGQRLPQNLGSFIVGIQVPFEGERDVLQMQMSTTTLPEEPDAAAMVLDLLYFLGQPGTVTFQGVFEWLQQAHDRIEEAFEGCLKESLRELFGEVKE